MGIFIYTLSDPISKEVRYIGKSNKPTNRLKSHIKESYKKNTHKNNWVNGLVIKNHTPIMEIIDEVEENWQFWESFYIDLMKSWGFKLTNMTNGGEGVNFTPEISEKISNTLKLHFKTHDNWIKGKKMSDEQKEKISLTKTGVAIHSEEHKNTLRVRMKGNTHTLGMKLSEEHKKSIGDKQRGIEKHTEETKKIISEKNGGKNNGMYGKTHTEEALKKISERSKGQNHPRSKLTEEDVLLIRDYYVNKTYNQKEMSKMFNVSYSLIQKITQRVLWQHI